MMNLDDLQMILSVACPGNELIVDNQGNASVMVRIPRQTYAQLGLGTSEDVHPAFIVNGREVDAIYISKYENVIINGFAYSLPNRVPDGNMDYDTAIKVCADKGLGWHLMSKVEWALLAQWCLQNGTLPQGNSKLGRDPYENTYKAQVGTRKDGQINLVLSGTGPIEWSHDRTPSGIWDLKGNLGEWVSGVRTVFGELQVLANNDAADSRNQQTADSSAWKAVHAETGELITPDQKGTTLHSLKLEYDRGRWVWVSKEEVFHTESFCAGKFAEITCDDSVASPARFFLQVLGLYGGDGNASLYSADAFYANTGAAEKFFGCGGHFRHGTEAGVFCSHGTTGRTDTSPTRGFRCAYVRLKEM